MVNELCSTQEREPDSLLLHWGVGSGVGVTAVLGALVLQGNL